MENIQEHINFTEVLNETLQNITNEVLQTELISENNESPYNTTLIYGLIIPVLLYLIYNFFGKYLKYF